MEIMRVIALLASRQNADSNRATTNYIGVVSSIKISMPTCFCITIARFAQDKPLWSRKAKGRLLSEAAFFVSREVRMNAHPTVYFTILDTTPAPTVRPPSRIAKRRPSSIAIGAISSTLNFRLSPGMTISVPSGRTTVPVTSVVRK